MGPKKAKLTKKEKLALKLAEEERIRQEEELARKIAEEEEQQRLEEERIRLEELERIRLEEAEIREKEQSTLISIITSIGENYKSNLELQWKESQWFKYVNVWKTINPFSLPMVNAFLSEWEDDESCNFKDIFSECHQCLQIIEELESALLNSPELDVKTEMRYNEILTNVRIKLSQKFDVLTFFLLRHGADYISQDSYNMEFGITDTDVCISKSNLPPTITLCLWINFVKNVRYRGMDLPRYGFSFQLPQELVLQSCAVRILHTSFDNVTCGVLETEDVTECIESIVHEVEEQKEEEEEEMALSEDDIGEFSMPPADMHTADHVELAKSIISISDVDETSSFATSTEETAETESLSSFSKHSSSIVSTSSAHIVPSGVEIGKSVALTFPPPSEPEIVLIDMNLYFPVGGIFHFDLLEVPKQPLSIGFWKMIFAEDKVLKRIPHKTSIIPLRQPEPYMSPAIAAEFADFEIRRFEKEMSQSISVHFRIPKGSLHLEQPVPAFWLEKEKGFTNNGFFDVQLEGDEQENIAFKTNQFGEIVLLQRRYANYPYEFWQLTPATDSATLTIKGTIISFEIKVTPKGCSIESIQFLEKKETVFQELYHTFMSPAELVAKLLSLGINISCDEEGYQSAGFTAKDQHVEQWCYTCMSILSHVFSFSSSHWNAKVSSEHVVLKCRENIEDPNEDKLILVDQERALYLKCKDHQTFSDEPVEGQKFFSNLYHLLIHEASETLQERIADVDINFSMNLRLLLDSCKLLTCC